MNGGGREGRNAAVSTVARRHHARHPTSTQTDVVLQCIFAEHGIYASYTKKEKKKYSFVHF